jgi:hypothetical protein
MEMTEIIPLNIRRGRLVVALIPPALFLWSTGIRRLPQERIGQDAIIPFSTHQNAPARTVE